MVSEGLEVSLCFFFEFKSREHAGSISISRSIDAATKLSTLKSQYLNTAIILPCLTAPSFFLQYNSTTTTVVVTAEYCVFWDAGSEKRVHHVLIHSLYRAYSSMYFWRISFFLRCYRHNHLLHPYSASDAPPTPTSPPDSASKGCPSPKPSPYHYPLQHRQTLQLLTHSLLSRATYSFVVLGVQQ